MMKYQENSKITTTSKTISTSNNSESQEKSYDVFLSYNHDSSDIVNLIYEKLRNEFRVWIDSHEVKNQNLAETIIEGINNSLTFLCCVTKRYTESKYTIGELDHAWRINMPLVVIMLERLRLETCGSVGFQIGPLARYNFYKSLGNENDKSMLLNCKRFDKLLNTIRKLTLESKIQQGLRDINIGFEDHVGIKNQTEDPILPCNLQPILNKFIKRTELLNKIYEVYKREQGVILCSHGGIGKTCLANEMGQMMIEKKHMVRLFTAKTRDKIEIEIRSLARLLKINIENLEYVEILNKLNSYLEKLKKNHYLFIFDNVEKFVDIEDILQIIPKKVKILITTRDNELTDVFPIIKVLPFTQHETVEFINKNLRKQKKLNDQQMNQLISMVKVDEYILPLKLNLTVNYLNQNFTKSFEMLTKRIASQTEINKEVEDYLFDDLSLNNPQALQILMVLSYLDPDHISFKILNKLFPEEEVNLEECLNSLNKQGLIDIDYEKEGIIINRIIQQELINYRKRKDIIGDEAKIIANIIDVLNTSVKNVDETNADEDIYLKPIDHVEESVTNEEEKLKEIRAVNLNEIEMLQIIELINTLDTKQKDEKVPAVVENIYISKLKEKLAKFYFYEEKKYQNALNIFINVKETVLEYYKGSDHLDVADALKNVANSYSKIGDEKNALKFSLEATNMRIRLCEGDDPTVADSIKDNGDRYFKLKKFKQAKNEYEKSLRMRERLLAQKGLSDHILLVSLNMKMALCYANGLNNEKMSLELNLIANDMLTRLLQNHNEDYPYQKAKCLSAIGLNYYRLCEFDKAIVFHLQAYTIRFKLYFDKDHLDFYESLNELGRTYLRIRSYLSAVEYFQKAFEMKLRLSKEKEFDELIRLCLFIAECFIGLRNTKKSYEYILKARNYYDNISGKKKAFKNKIIEGVMIIADQYFEMSNYSEALKIYLDMNSKDLKSNLSVANLHIKIGNCYSNLNNQYEEAHKFYLKAYEIKSKEFKESNNADLVTVLNLLGVTCAKMKRFDEGLKYISKAEELALKICNGNDNEQLAYTKNALGVVYTELNQHDTAFDYYVQAFAMRERLYKGKGNKELLKSMFNLAIIYMKRNDFDNALLLFIRAYDMQRKLIDDVLFHEDLYSLKIKIAKCYILLSKDNEALRTLTEACDMAKKLYNQEPHPNLVNVYQLLGQTYLRLSDLNNALKYLLESFNMNVNLTKNLNLTFDFIMLILNITLCYLKLNNQSEASKYSSMSLKYLDEYWTLTIDDSSKFEILNQMLAVADCFKDLSNYREALAIYEAIIEDENETYSKLELANIFMKIGNVHSKLKDHKMAKKCFLKSIKLRKDNKNEDLETYEMIKNLYLLGKSFISLKQFKKGLESLLKAHEMCLPLYNDQPQEILAKIKNEIGIIYVHNIDKKDEALVHLNDAYKMRLCLYKDKDCLEVVESLENIGLYYLSQNKLNESLEHFNKAYQMRLKATDGIDHKDLFNILIQIAVCESKLGEEKRACEYYSKAYDMINRLYGGYEKPHEDVLKCLQYLAQSYFNLEDYEKALSVYTKLYELKSVQLGKMHLDCLKIRMRINVCNFKLNNSEESRPIKELSYVIDEFDDTTLISLGDDNQKLGSYTEAIRYYLKAYENHKGGELNNKHFIDVLIKLGHTYSEIMDFNQSIYFYKRAYKLRKSLLKPNEETIELATLMIQLGNQYVKYQRENMLKKGFGYHTRAYEMYLRLFGEDNPQLIYSMNALANTYCQMREYDQSLTLYKKSFQLLQASKDRKDSYIGNINDDFCLCLIKIGKCYSLKDDETKANEIFTNAYLIACKQETSSSPHNILSTCQYYLGRSYFKLENYNKAIEYLAKSHDIRKLNNQHKNDLTFYKLNYYMALSYLKLNDMFKATQSFEIAFNFYTYDENYSQMIREKLEQFASCCDKLEQTQQAINYRIFLLHEIEASADKSKLKTIVRQIGEGYLKLNKYDNAIKYFSKAAFLNGYLFSSDKEFMFMLCIMLGICYNMKAKYAKALNHHLKAYQMYELIYGNEDNLNVALLFSSLSDTYFNLDNYEKSLKLCEKAYEMYERLYENSDHKHVSLTLSKLGQIWTCLNNETKAFDFYMRAYEMSFRINEPSSEQFNSCELLANNAELLGESYFRLENYTEALKYYDTSKNLKLKIYNDKCNDVIKLNGKILICSCKLNTEESDQALKQIALNNPNTQIKMSSSALKEYALIYSELQLLDLAIEYGIKAYNQRKNELNDKYNPNQIELLNKIGSDYMKAGNNYEAKRFIKKAVSRSFRSKQTLFNEKVLSNNLNNLGICYFGLPNGAKKSLKYNTKACSLLSSVLKDSDDPQLAYSLNALGVSNSKLGHLDKALDYFTKSYEMKMRLDSNTDSCDLVKSLYNLGSINQKLANYTKAHTFYSEAYDMNLRIVKNENHRDLVDLLVKLGDVNLMMYTFKESLAKYIKVFEMKETLNVKNDDFIFVHVTRSMAICYLRLKDFEKSLELSRISLNLAWKIQNKHPQTALSLSCHGLILAKINENNKALDYGIKGYKMIKSIFYHKKLDKFFIQFLQNLGDIYFQIENMNLSLKYYLKAYMIRIKEFKFKSQNEDISFAVLLYNISLNYFCLNEYDKALTYGLRSYNLFFSLYSFYSVSIHSNLIDSINSISLLYSKMGDEDKSIEFKEYANKLNTEIERILNY